MLTFTDDNRCFLYIDSRSSTWIISHFLDLLPGEVQNLKSTSDRSTGSLSLEWDRPINCETDQDVTAYDIRFRPSGSSVEEGYCKVTVKAPTRSIVLTRESGLKPLMRYDFEVRAQNASYDGNWSRESKYVGTCISLLFETMTNSFNCKSRKLQLYTTRTTY